jgi:zinc resistance-associated protein
MKRKPLKTVLVTVSVIALIGMGTYAFADWGQGYGPGGGRGKHGPGYGPGAGCQGPCWSQNLTDEQIEKLRAGRQSFMDDTADLRRDIQSKRLALQSEMVKKNPDAAKASAMLDELSSLRAEMAQKRLAHGLEMRKIAPEAGPGWMGGGFHGRGQGRGFHDRGTCMR